MQIEQNLSSGEWDRELGRLGGHPWQSALWGDARRDVDGIVDHRWLVRRGRNVVQMVRFEERRIGGLGKAAWIPRGPVVARDTTQMYDLAPELRDRLRRQGFTLAVANPWASRANNEPPMQDNCPRTIWIDLTIGREQLWRNLERQVRYGVSRAERSNIKIERSPSEALVREFFKLCDRVSHNKKFELRTSEALMHSLLTSSVGTDTEAQLFLGRCDSRIAAGAFVLRCGRSIHYLWGASDRALSQHRAAEAVQWSIIGWALGQGCTRYDLEGIDPAGNPGTYAFKKKLGGEEVTLMSRRVQPLDLKGQLLAPFASYALESRWAALPSLVRSVWAQRRSSPQHSTPSRSGERVARTS